MNIQIFLFAVTLLFLALVITEIKRIRFLLKHGKKIKGKVIELEPHSYYSSNQIKYNYTIVYFESVDENGQVRIGHHKTETGMYQLNQEINLWYDPKRPEFFRIDNWFEKYMKMVTYSISFLAFLAIFISSLSMP